MIQKYTILALLCLFVAACSANPTSAPSPVQPSATLSPVAPSRSTPSGSPSPNPLPPSPTPEPLAGRVNGEGISLVEYNAELQRMQAAVKETGSTLSAVDQQKKVFNDLVDQFLLAQQALKDGYKADDATLQKRLDDLIRQAGGAQAFSEWLKKNFYTEDSLKAALRRTIAAAWERDRIYASAPTTAEQVHARQILLLDPDTATRFYNQLQAGADFATLAFQADPDLGGDMGWFPRGYLLLPEIEKVAFELEPGKYSPIIQTAYGYQIIQVLEKEANHILSADARGKLQQQLLANWLKDQASKSTIEVLAPPVQ